MVNGITDHFEYRSQPMSRAAMNGTAISPRGSRTYRNADEVGNRSADATRAELAVVQREVYAARSALV